jgi:transposase
MPEVGIAAMNKHLAEISQSVSVSATALLILDGAGWHGSPKVVVPDNIVLMPLPPYAAELNSVENVWDYLRSNFLSHRVWETYDEIVDACCDAWKALMAKSEIVTSIGARSWAQVKT